MQGLPTGKLTIAEKSLLSDALNSRNKIRALIELPEVIIKALHRNALSSKDAIEICMKILEVKMESLLCMIFLNVLSKLFVPCKQMMHMINFFHKKMSKAYISFVKEWNIISKRTLYVYKVRLDIILYSTPLQRIYKQQMHMTIYLFSSILHTY